MNTARRAPLAATMVAPALWGMTYVVTTELLLVATIAGWTLLGQRRTVSQLAGAVLVLFAINLGARAAPRAAHSQLPR